MIGVQYVLEAVPERLPLKQQLFVQFEGCCPEDAILATNTSGLRITDIAAVCQHPERVGGMHWANPAEIVPLVEVIRGERTSDNTVDVIYRVTEKLGKMPVVVNKDIPGFVSNRLQYAVFREALHLVEADVVSAQDVDRTLKCGVGFRYPWLGPLETADLGRVGCFPRHHPIPVQGIEQHDHVARHSLMKLSERASWASRPGRGFPIIKACRAMRFCAGATSILFASSSSSMTLRPASP